MKILNVLSFMCVLLFMPLIVHAKSSDLAVGIASDHIDVTVGFDGSSVELFGDRRDSKADVAIVVEGPKKNVIIWQKARVMGTWVNRYFAKFDNIPMYYHYALSADDVDEPLLMVMSENGIGHDALFNKVSSKKSRKLKNLKFFQEALLRKNSDLGVYFKQPEKVEFMNDNFFRVSFDIPPSAPTGEYKIRSFLIKDGKVIESTLDLLKVEQVGLNAFVYKSAHNYGFLYAIVCIFLALFSGWFVSVLRVRP